MSTKSDLDKIIEIARSGSADAQFFLGKYYSDERYRDDVEAFKWLLLAANQGHGEAQMFVGYSYEIGEGIPKNIKLAVKYYAKAYFNGHEVAKTASLKYLKDEVLYNQDLLDSNSDWTKFISSDYR